jgi:glycosyltransferase involved in cell wall biosynthesis
LNNLTVIVTAINETYSLEKTIEILLSQNFHKIKQIIFAIAPKTTDSCRNSIAKTVSKYPNNLIEVHEQCDLPGVGGAIRESFERVKGEYVVIMASDLETDPMLVKLLHEEIENNNLDVVATTRWAKGGSFAGYSPTKLLLNKVFQKIFGILYKTDLTDMTYGYRIYRTSSIMNIKWTETNHSFFFESILRPIKLNLKIKEIPASWTVRIEGDRTALGIKEYLKYFKVGIAIYRERN